MTDSAYSSSQAKALALIRSFTGTLSLLGSMCILYIIVSRKKFQKTYDRLLFMTSIIDAMVSCVFIVFFLFVPEDATDFDWAIGNTASCSTAGFFAQFGFAVSSYNCSLSLYYLLTIRYQKEERFIAKRVEPIMHLVSILLPLISGIIGASLGLFNPWPQGVGCWFEEYPPNCDVDKGECTRGEQAWLFSWLFGGVPIFITILVVTTNYVLIYRTVRNQEERNRQHAFLGRRSEESIKRQRAVAVQATLYSLVFVNTFIWTIIAEITQHFDANGTFGFWVLSFIFFPSQGFFNCLIYIRQRYYTLRERYPTKSRLWALREVVVASKGKPPGVSSEGQKEEEEEEKDASTTQRLSLRNNSEDMEQSAQEEGRASPNESNGEKAEIKASDDTLSPNAACSEE